jgi:hypothetical protein
MAPTQATQILLQGASMQIRNFKGEAVYKLDSDSKAA